jgi:hypothetical protein
MGRCDGQLLAVSCHPKGFEIDWPLLICSGRLPESRRMEIRSLLITARVTFLSEEDGGRSDPAINTSKYRPSIVFGDLNQRKPILGEDGRTLIEPYRMAAFAGDGETLLPGNPYDTELVISYYPDLSGYETPEPGDTFTIREGPRIVGFGEVLEVPRD